MANLTLQSCGLPPWEELAEIYHDFHERGAQLVTRWKFAVDSAGLERPELFWLQRTSRRPATLLDAAPPGQPGIVRYAFAQDAAVPVLSEFYGADEQVDSAWLRWMINRVVFHMRFSLEGARPELLEVVVEGSDAEERLVEVIAFTNEGQSIHREEYHYDATGRVILIESMDGTPAGVESKSVVGVTFGDDGPTFASQHLRADEDFSAAPVKASGAAVEPPTPPAVVAAAAQMVESLCAAVATWYERAPRSAAIRRILLVHSWPVNPPFPPVLLARSGGWLPGSDPFGLFEPEPDIDDWIVADPREFRDPEIRANAAILNGWSMDIEYERSPFELLVEVASATKQEITRRTGREVWIMPIDHDMSDAARAVKALLPPDVANPILEALQAAEEDH